MATKKSKATEISIKLGGRFAVNDVLCKVRFVNNNKGWLSPIVDDSEDPSVRRHIAYGTVDSTGKISKL